MALPDPRPGLVIRYAYLWRDQFRFGQEEGLKDRPCVIILAVDNLPGGPVVTVAPITHSPPKRPDEGVEIPSTAKQRLGLDGARSWIVSTEVNRFIWPGPDLRPISRGARVYAFGFVPAGLLQALREQIVRNRRISLVPRDDVDT
jgi:hypothetical protein